LLGSVKVTDHMDSNGLLPSPPQDLVLIGGTGSDSTHPPFAIDLQGRPKKLTEKWLHFREAGGLGRVLLT
jgi:hypothetical protein